MASKPGQRAPCVNQSLSLVILPWLLGSRAGPKLPGAQGAAAHSLEDRSSLAGFLGLQSAQPKVWG